MILLGFRYALRERTRFALTAAGVAAAVLLTVFLVGVYRGATRGSLSYIEGTGADVWVGRRGTWNLLRAGGLIPVSAKPLLEQVKGVVSAEPILGALLPAKLSDGRRTLLTIGLPAGATLSRPRQIEAGRAMPRRGEIVLDRAFARRAGLRVGDRVELAERKFRVAGISRETNLLVTQYAFLLRQDLESLLGVDAQATFFLLRVRQGESAAVVRRLEHRSRLISVFDRATFLENNRREIAAGFLPVLAAVALIGLLIGAAVVALMSYAAVLEKRGDYALIGALGGSEGARFLVVMQQSLAAALTGALAGLAVLLVVGRILPAAVPEVELVVEPWVAAAAVLGAFAVAAIGALIPAGIATSVAPMEALRR
jgi:putative ABC transport system permease protein